MKNLLVFYPAIFLTYLFGTCSSSPHKRKVRVIHGPTTLVFTSVSIPFILSSRELTIPNLLNLNSLFLPCISKACRAMHLEARLDEGRTHAGVSLPTSEAASYRRSCGRGRGGARWPAARPTMSRASALPEGRPTEDAATPTRL
jgi:hypothetical protein